MRRLALLGGLLAVVDAGVAMGPLGSERIEPSVSPVADRMVAEQVRPVEQREREAQWAAAIVARPLFEPGRRPPELIGLGAPAPETQPRLTGIVVSGATRRALFVTPDEVARGEGEQLGPFTVLSIRVGAVDLTGPEGLRTVYPASDAEFRAQRAGARPVMALVGAEQRETTTETDQ